MHTSVESTAPTRSAVKPYAALLIGVLSISTSAVFVKLSDAPAAIVALYRLLFTVMLMTPWIVVHQPDRTEGVEAKRLVAGTCLRSFFSLPLHILVYVAGLHIRSPVPSY